ncbi:gamma-glutamylcyclotransferase [Pantoea allii]|uniref:Gamma-glutamylcyclotransferase n=1 Tax=Pantoea allii TaxID=574096 RepID=A0ABS6VF75_9GAMM|nr:gamma-glutamylcyclotransferase [Pantoea allii]MBW1214433.1 gamma-glutamylcyclotransferase [Pantoea allii]MBW1257966.1 gamma-glutamylcyclotransferase [Pantoea allii]MBW1266841.1 gamma-glutamylcyclotransferase [Pantoea allii]MBW1288956.1 gamma-glutamylcyclotransferase [Pantoea allii]
METLFVYGTLCPGRSNAHILEGIGGIWQTGFVSGFYFPEGRGAATGFPGIVVDDQAPRVNGFLFSSDNLSLHWPMLDEFEAGYDRIRVETFLENGDSVTAWIYQLQPQSVPSSAQ